MSPWNGNTSKYNYLIHIPVTLVVSPPQEINKHFHNEFVYTQMFTEFVETKEREEFELFERYLSLLSDD